MSPKDANSGSVEQRRRRLIESRKRKGESRKGQEERREREAARRKRLLAAIGGFVATALALLTILGALSDPERCTMVLAVAAAMAWLAMWLVDWYGTGRSFWAVFAIFGAIAAAAVLVETIDAPPAPISTWRTEHALERVDRISTGDRPRAIAAHGRYVWVVGLKTEAKKGLLWRIDSKNLGPAAREFSSFQARDPFDIAVDDEAVWVSDGDRLIKLDLEGNEVWRRVFGDGGENEVDVRFGKVWFKETSTGKIFIVDPVSGDLLHPPVEVGPEAIAIAVGLGSVWVSSSDEEGSPRVIRLDQSGEVMGEIHVQDDPQDLAAGRHYVYVSHSNDGLVTRIDPDRGPFGEEVPGLRYLKGTGPFGGIDAGSGTVWAPLAGSGHAFAIAECTYKAIGHMRSGDSPYDVVVLRGKAFVPNFNGGDVTVFRLKQPVCTHAAKLEAPQNGATALRR